MPTPSTLISPPTRPDTLTAALDEGFTTMKPPVRSRLRLSESENVFAPETSTLTVIFSAPLPVTSTTVSANDANEAASAAKNTAAFIVVLMSCSLR